ncbi:MAG TPA: preprotein translocase subunit SecY [Chitinophagales bacterium]|nr:preprotein translocase subunit SecY [Chitinophagales bacterium]HMU70254.1 preprotein translocase subunit SecY [Chitinophagales bacterium]HMX03953.1 preprotein translocase subunit SecY [Chitinophagales bacterium]HMZ88235.1 preprotein translocase subunit SecY [Chitinophagales bacterium]HNA56756.1 preprotein translocase subunit SecY [Chitinophagales bacterium]
MKQFIQTLKNIWSIEDLRKRIIYSLGLILLYRFGSYVMLPGIDAGIYNQAANVDSQSGLLGLINLFAGGGFSRASIFALGIMPYISASIAIQLLGIAVPYFARLQKEGESGRRKMNQYTRYLTVIVTALQASGYYAYLNTMSKNADFIVAPQGLFWFITVVILTAGTLFTMWMGERITDKGIGNGISMIIMVGIIAGLPAALVNEITHRGAASGGGFIPFLLEIAFLIVVIMGCILLVQGTRRIPVQYAKRVVGSRQYGGVRQYIPLKINAAGVMPIIFAQALMFIPGLFAQINEDWQSSPVLVMLNDFQSLGYNLIYGFLIVLFTYFYTAIIINPSQIADDLKKNGGFIPGIKPGKKTSEFIDNVLSRITLPGSIFLALVAISPVLTRAFHVDPSFARFFGGTSLLIMVGVILDTLQQIESHLLMRHYDGLMKSGRIKGRTNAPVSIQQG